MVINTSSFRRYTPPTCTLEIYHPHFWGNWGAKTFPPQFSFQLHFDDPRLPKSEKSIILGDRNLLEKLREKVNEYISKYLDVETLEVESLTCALPLDNQEEFISISRDSSYRHRLFYQCFFPKEETLEVILTNTQLFDFVNALCAYHYDATKPMPESDHSISSHIGLSITITALAFALGGGIWWRYERQMADTIPIQQTENEIIPSNMEDVIPPNPLDPNTLPSIVAPEVPESLRNREALLPPPPTITQPPQSPDSNIVDNNTPESNNNIPPQPSQQANLIIVPQPPAPAIPNLPPPTMVETPAPNIMALQPLPPPVAPSFQPSQPPPSPPQYPSRLSTLPTLQPNNPEIAKNTTIPQSSNTPLPGINTLNSVSPNVIESRPNFEQQISRLNSLDNQKSAGILSNEVRQYFQNKWQPPENLKQSIEYRLKFNQNGSLAKVTPVGQVAIVFLDRTGIPLLGEKITSPFSDQEEVTVRLILSPNGNVQTFHENR